MTKKATPCLPPMNADERRLKTKQQISVRLSAASNLFFRSLNQENK
jgi:hypothetical protein